MINNPQDFASKRGIAQFDALVALGHTINRRLLTVEEISQDCFVAVGGVRRLGQSTVETGGQRASALRFGDERVMALMAALAQRGHIPRGLSNRTLCQHVALLLDDPTYSSAHMSYDLRRLRLKGVIQRLPQSQTYVLTEFGVKVAQFFTKLYTRLFRPGLAALVPDQPPLPGTLADVLATVSDLINALVTEAQLGAPISP